MKRYYISEFNVTPSATECCAEKIEKVIVELPDDSENGTFNIKIFQ